MPQKHTTIRDGKRYLWYIERLWQQAKNLTPFKIEISSIKELDQNCWFESREPTLREVAKYCERINAADLSYPIILNDNGTLMEGGHRLCKSQMEGKSTIVAVQFKTMPKPDKILEITGTSQPVNHGDQGSI